MPDPTIRKPTDAILRVTAAGICGSDLHYYSGRIDAGIGWVIGHEYAGVVEEVDPVDGIVLRLDSGHPRTVAGEHVEHLEVI